jgi:hypothetical protein
MRWFLEIFLPAAYGCPYAFLCPVMEAFNLELYHFSPNGILTLSKFCWAYESYGATPHIDTFCTYFELQRQPKKI